MAYWFSNYMQIIDFEIIDLGMDEF